MLLSLVASLALGTSLADLKLERKNFDTVIASSLSNGLRDAPLGRYSLPVPLPPLSNEDKAALTREALAQAKVWLSTEAGQKLWLQFLGYSMSETANEAAEIAANVAYWSTLVKEHKNARATEAEELARATARQKGFNADRSRLDREAATRVKAAALRDSAAFTMQLKERLTYFLAETQRMPWDAKLEEKGPVKRFVSSTLESKPKWWKFCWRAGPEATTAAREFAAQWLAELDAPPSPSKLSDEK